MPSLEDRFDVVIDAKIWKLKADGTREKEADGSDKLFTGYPLFYRDLPLLMLNRVQRAVCETLLDLGDEGAVLVGGEQAVAILEAMGGARDKAAEMKSKREKAKAPK